MEYRTGLNPVDVQTRSIPHPLLEIAAVLSFPLVIIWVTPLLIGDRSRRDPADLVLSAAALSVAIGLNLRHREGFRDIGLRWDNFVQAGREIAGFTVIGAAVLMAVGWSFQSLSFGRRFLLQMAVLPFWGLQQHYGIQAIINRRWQMIFGRGIRSVLLTAMTFSALHVPNPTLMVATFIAGLFWSSEFQRRPNLFSLALSHAFLSALLANSFPAFLLPNMKVGWGYYGIP